jgi:hypothetical protein
VYKLVQYADKGIFKTSPDKHSRPGRKTITRIKNKLYKKDVISTFNPESEDLLKPFESAEQTPKIQQRLDNELSLLNESIKTIRNPEQYTVEFL